MYVMTKEERACRKTIRKDDKAQADKIRLVPNVERLPISS